MKKTVLITGAGGYLGQVVVRDLAKSRKYNVHLLFEDINDHEAVNQHLFSSPTIDVVIHLAALVPSSGGTAEETIKTNYFATRNLARSCKNSHFIFLSTEAVFKGDTDAPREVDDIKNPETAYGVSKSLSEEFLLKESDIKQLTILRTSMLYGYDKPERKNFLRFLYECMESSEEAEVFTDVYNRPTHINDLSSFILSVIKEKTTGVIHAVSEDYVSRYELSKIFCDAHGYSQDLLIPINQPADGRQPGQLNLKPSELFTKQIKFPLRNGIMTCLKGIVEA